MNQRDLKFRVWDKKEKKMFDVLSIVYWIPQSDGTAGIREVLTYDGEKDFDDVILMQYTGLEDEDKKEIYEGDVMEINFIEKPRIKGEVVWNNDKAKFEIKDEEGLCQGEDIIKELETYRWEERKDQIYEKKIGNIKKIGNVYETNMNQNQKEAKNVIPMANLFDHISPRDLDDIMEWLGDNDYLSETGKDFKTAFWQLFICKNVSKNQGKED